MATKTSWTELEDADFYDATSDAYEDEQMYEDGDDIAARRVAAEGLSG